MNELIRSIEAKQLRTDLTPFGIGDTVRVWVKVVEGAAYLTASASHALSRSTLPVWTMWI